MIDTQAIRKKILDLALQGKLTEQLPEDGTADELYRQIITENKLRKNGKSAQQYPIEEEMIPCSIPDNWIWTKVGNLITLVSGTDFKPEDYNDVGNGLPYMTGASNIDDDHLVINRWTPVPKNISYKGDLLLVCKGSGFGKLVLNNVPEVHIARQFMAIRPFGGLNVNYIKAVMENSFNTIKEAGKGLIPGVDRETVLNLYLPLPPVAEQQRIVEKVESLFSILYTIDTLQSQYQDNLATLKSKIIDAGIQGKLTEQLPEDGTAEELYQQIQQERKSQEASGKIKKEELFPDIEDQSIPFPVPNTWLWTYLGNVSYIIRGGSPRPIKQYITHDTNGINWIKIGDVEKGGKYIYQTNERIIPEGEKKSRRVYPGDFLLTNSMSFGRPYISQIEGCIHDGWLLIRNLNGFDPDYLYYLLSSSYLYGQFTEKASGSTVDNLNIDKVKSAMIPLPPLSEQKRIVAKLEELLPLCEGSKGKNA